MQPTAIAANQPLARSAAYKLFSELFRYPEEEVFRSFQDRSFHQALAAALRDGGHGPLLEEAVGEPLEAFHGEIRTQSLTDFQGRYMATFDLGQPDLPVPPNEGLYRQGMPRQRLLLELIQAYRHFGLETSTAAGGELPDHLTLELEFMHFLAFKEHQARAEGDTDHLDGYVLAQQDFLERHLGLWVDDFEARAAERAPAAFAQAAPALAAFVRAEADRAAPAAGGEG